MYFVCLHNSGWIILHVVLSLILLKHEMHIFIIHLLYHVGIRLVPCNALRSVCRWNSNLFLKSCVLLYIAKIVSRCIPRIFVYFWISHWKLVCINVNILTIATKTCNNNRRIVKINKSQRNSPILALFFSGSQSFR